MTVITHKRRKSRLADMIDKAGGISVTAALAQAKENIEQLRDEGLAYVSEHLTTLSEIVPPTTPEETTERLRVAYDESCKIVDAAAPFELLDICTAAAGLCDLVDSHQPGAPFDWRIVPVHAQAMRLLLGMPEDAREERKLVLDNLRQVLNRKLASQAD